MNRLRGRLWTELLVIVALTGLAFVVRTYRLESIPFGLYFDEAANGLDILEVINDHHYPIFFERNSGREPLFIYLQAISVALLGATPFALRLTAAVLGSLTISAIYWMVREAFADNDERSRWLAVWVALFVALSYWHINFSRLGFRVIMLPLVSALTFACFWRAWRHLESGRRFPWPALFLCGFFLGLSLYTYLASRFLPLVLLGVGIAGIVMHGRTALLRRRELVAMAVIALVALLVFAPLGLYFLQHPGSFLGHATDTSVFNPVYNKGNPLRALATSILETTKMFAIRGDPNPRHNPAQRPLLDPLLAAWLLLGLVLSIAKWRSLQRLWLVAWLGVFAIPVVFAIEGMPHSLRGLGMLPPMFMLIVLAMDDVRAAILSRWRGVSRSRLGRWTILLLPLPFLLLSGYTSLRDYYSAWQWEQDPNLIRAFEVDTVRMAGIVAQEGGPEDTWILPIAPVARDATDPYNFTLDFLAYPRKSGLVPSGTGSAPIALNRLATGRNYGSVAQWFRMVRPLKYDWLYHADPKHLIDFLLSKYGRKLAEHDDVEVPYTVYEFPVAPDYRVAPELEPVNAVFGDKVELTRAAFGRTTLNRAETPAATELRQLPSGHTAWAVLNWTPQQPIDNVLKVSLRLLDPDGHVAGQVDDLLVGDKYPFIRTWQIGEGASTYHILPTLPAVAPGTYELHALVYDDRTRQIYPAGPKTPSAPIGALEITRPISTPVVAPQNPPPTGTCPWAELCLLGFDLPTGDINPGDKLPLTLYWRAESKPEAEYLISLRLLDDTGQAVVTQRSGPANGRSPTTGWEMGDIVRDWHDLALPPTMPGGAYRLALGLSSDARNLGEVNLGRIDVSSRPRQFVAPAISQPLEKRFGEAIALRGVDLGTATIRGGEPLKLRLVWNALDQVRIPYTVFVHVLAADGQIVAQQDTVPDQGASPTSSWIKGEYVTDAYQISLRPDLPPGPYQLRIGLYDATTGSRLPVFDANGHPMGDHVLLEQTIQIVEQ